MTKHLILETPFGEVLVEQAFNDDTLDCYIGDNYDEYIGSIEGSIYYDETSLINQVKTLLE